MKRGEPPSRTGDRAAPSALCALTAAVAHRAAASSRVRRPTLGASHRPSELFRLPHRRRIGPHLPPSGGAGVDRAPGWGRTSSMIRGEPMARNFSHAFRCSPPAAPATRPRGRRRHRRTGHTIGPPSPHAGRSAPAAGNAASGCWPTGPSATPSCRWPGSSAARCATRPGRRSAAGRRGRPLAGRGSVPAGDRAGGPGRPPPGLRRTRRHRHDRAPPGRPQLGAPRPADFARRPGEVMLPRTSSTTSWSTSTASRSSAPPTCTWPGARTASAWSASTSAADACCAASAPPAGGTRPRPTG